MRDATHLLGKPPRGADCSEGLTPGEVRRLQNDNTVTHFYKTVAEHCETNGVTWTLEARADSWMWEQVAIKRIEATLHMTKSFPIIEERGSSIQSRSPLNDMNSWMEF